MKDRTNQNVRRFPVWAEWFLLIWQAALLVLLAVLVCKQHDYVYGLPENALPLYLEEGTTLFATTSSMEDSADLRFFNLSGASLAESFSVQEGETIHVALRETIGQVKVVFVSSAKELILVEDSGDITLPAGPYALYCVGEHFWGEVTLSR